MNKRQLSAGLVAAAILCTMAQAGIPEPDNIIYGQMCIAGVPAAATDDVTIVAKTTVATQVVEVGRYKMGDSDAATDCNGDADCYILRIRLESVPAGETASSEAVILNRANPATVQLFLIQGEGAEQQIAELEITDSAVIRRLDLRDVPATVDLNGDGQENLSDYQVFAISIRGPIDPAPGTCNTADLNGDGFVDLLDFGLFQAMYSVSAE